ncbi:PREDICTED: nesprin-1-like [Priapulus caudatus]|uniref:Nesprin-1-like n=1 Tax=Priapulus caudatus TaxID=37621 RepID=A0ABM1ECZ2_PRICU|nr:PREDICTED: nesprin-1-like [Priapulus caudatus]
METKLSKETSLDSQQSFLKSLEDKGRQLLQWLQKMEKTLITASEPKDTLDSKRKALHNVKSIHETVLSEQTAIAEDYVEQVMQAGSEQLSDLASTLMDKYTAVVQKCQNHEQCCMDIVEDHVQYTTCRHNCELWMSDMHDHIVACEHPAPGLNGVQESLDKLKELCASVESGGATLQEVEMAADKVLPNTASHKQEAVKSEMSRLKDKYTELSNTATEVTQTLELRKQQWVTFTTIYESFSQWLASQELNASKWGELRSTLEEKKQLVTTLHNAINEIEQQAEQLAEVKNAAAAFPEERTVTTQMTRASTHYEKLTDTAQQLLQTSETRADEHDAYRVTFGACRQALQSAVDQLAKSKDVTGGKDTLHEKLSVVEALEQDKPSLQDAVNDTVSQGDKVITNTTHDGQEIIQKKLAELKTMWSTYCSTIIEKKVALEQGLLQLAGFSVNTNKVIDWISNMETRLNELRKDEVDLEEIIWHCNEAENLHRDVVGYQQMVDSLQAQAAELLSEQTADFTAVIARYAQLCAAAEELVHAAQQRHSEHQQYQQGCKQLTTWLDEGKAALTAAVDICDTTDQLQTKFDTVQELTEKIVDGNAKLDVVKSESETLAPRTTEKGRDSLTADINRFEQGLIDYRFKLAVAESDLQSGLITWHEIQLRCDVLTAWLQHTTVTIQAPLEMQSHLSSKEAYLEKFKN